MSRGSGAPGAKSTWPAAACDCIGIAAAAVDVDYVGGVVVLLLLLWQPTVP